MNFASLGDTERTADAIVSALANAGVDYVVGMPGGLTMPLWSALYEHPTITAVQVRQESLGAYMAEAYGRLTGRPIVVMGQGEWIVGNAGQGLIEALLGSSPVIVLTEMSDGGAFSHHAPYQSGTGDYGTWDARSALAAVTKRVLVSHDPAQAVQHVQLAIKHATTGDPGPVAVIFSSESLRGTVGPQSKPRPFPTRAYLPRSAPSAASADVKRLATALRQADRPVILGGNGVRVGQAWNSLENLARSMDVPVVTTAGGKGVFPENDPLSGGVMGPFGHQAANRLVGDADLLLVIGSRLSSSDTVEGSTALIDPDRQHIAQIDIEPLNVSWTTPIDHVLVGDAAVTMDALREAYGTGHAPRPSGSRRVAEVRQIRAPSDGGLHVTLHPRDIIATLNAAVPSNTVVTCDAGENRLFMMQFYAASGQGSYLQPAAGGGMGYAIPAAMGAKLARPDSPVLAVCGDGGFGMALNGVLTAVEQQLPIAVAILNNSALGWVLHGARQPTAALFPDTDFSRIAQAMGCDGVHVSTLTALHEAAERVGSLSRPLVIDIPTSLELSFKDVLQDVDVRRRETGY